MSVVAPSSLVDTGSGGTDIGLVWVNGEIYDYIAIYRKPEGGTYAPVTVDLDGTKTSYADTVNTNVLYTYRILGIIGMEWSDYSNESDAANWTAGDTDTCTVTDSKTVVVVFKYSKTETCILADIASYEHSAGEPGIYNVTETDTVTCTDTYETSLISGQDYMYYLGSSAGAIYPYSGEYFGDDTSDITSFWISKRTDFSDQYPGLSGLLKTVKGVILTYVDLDIANVTVGVSTDGGTNWTDVHKSIGTDNGKVKDAIYDFWKTGRFFSFRIRHNSNNRDFQWLRLTVEVEPQAEWRNVN